MRVCFTDLYLIFIRCDIFNHFRNRLNNKNSKQKNVLMTLYHYVILYFFVDLTVTGFDYTISAADFYQDIDIRIYFSITIKNDPVDCCKN